MAITVTVKSAIEQLLDQFITRHVALSPRARSLENARCCQTTIVHTQIELPTGERRPFGAWLVRDVTSDAIDKLKALRTQQQFIRKKDADGERAHAASGRRHRCKPQSVVSAGGI